VRGEYARNDRTHALDPESAFEFECAPDTEIDVNRHPAETGSGLAAGLFFCLLHHGNIFGPCRKTRKIGSGNCLFLLDRALGGLAMSKSSAFSPELVSQE
jgi:hypothetical protein